MGSSLLWMGDFAPAQIHFDQGLALYDFERHRSQAFLSGFDPGMLCITMPRSPCGVVGIPTKPARESTRLCA
jgi:hypothetical protein